MDKSNRGSIQLIWSHQNYDACRSEEGFAGFRDEYVTAHSDTNRGILEVNGDWTMAKSDNPNGTMNHAVTRDTAPVAGYEERITKRPKLTGFTRAVDDGSLTVTEFAGYKDTTTGNTNPVLNLGGNTGAADQAVMEQYRDSVHCWMHPRSTKLCVGKIDTQTNQFEEAVNGGLKLTREIAYPNFQRQEVPGMRGAQLTLKKIEVQFSKKEHNVEWIDIDLGNLIGRGAETLSCHLHNNATANVLRIFSDGESRRETHLYNMFIGEAADAQPEIGVRSVAYWPRHGMPCFGMAPGNDVYMCGGGSEFLRGQYRLRKQNAEGNYDLSGTQGAEGQDDDRVHKPQTGDVGSKNFPQWIDGRSNGGGTNGVLLRVNILLERVST